MSDFCGIAVRCDVYHPESRWRWLLRALGDVGMPVSGWSFSTSNPFLRAGGDRSAPFSFTARGSGEDFKRAIEDLWENERPGGTVEVEVGYG